MSTLISAQVEKIVTVYVTNDQPNALAPIDAGPVVSEDTEFFQDHLLARPEISLKDATLEMPVFRKDDDHIVFREIPDLKEHIRTLETRFLQTQSGSPLAMTQATFQMGAAGRGTHSAGASKPLIGMSVINPSVTATVGHAETVAMQPSMDTHSDTVAMQPSMDTHSDGESGTGAIVTRVSTHTHTQSLSLYPSSNSILDLQDKRGSNLTPYR